MYCNYYLISLKNFRYDLEENKMNEFVSAREASRQLKIGKEGISRCANGKLKTSGEYIWKFVRS